MHKSIGAAAAFMLLSAAPVFGADYFPPRGDGWSTHTPEQEKLDPAKLKQAVDFAISA